MSTNKSIRIRTTPGGGDKFVTLKVEQEFDFLEILSLKISQEDLYRSFCADYGVVVGRVIANRGFGLPNSKVSVFIPITDEDEKNDLIRDLYPYKTPADKDNSGIRYNLLMSKATCALNQAVGTFPTKEEVLNNEVVLEIFDKYYKYTTKTNSAGDYMIFGVPTGSRTIHMDVDLSDVGIASVRPYDLIEDGAPENLFESKAEFKKSPNLDSLPQIKSGNKGVDVIPFWGDPESCQIGITRVDFDTQFTIKPNAFFVGSIFSDTGKNSINKGCNPKNTMGEQDELRTGPGRIEMIRATKINPNDWVYNKEIVPTELEDFTIEGGDLIDDDGVFSFPVPMNIGHVVTDEFGNLVPSADPEIGIATKGMYRFKMNFSEPPENRKRRTASMLFPSLSYYHGGSKGYSSTGNVADIGGTEDQRFTDVVDDYKDIDKDFHLFEWKQIYTIAHFIKKFKKGTNRFSFLGIKNADVSGETNLFPYNTAVYKFDILFVIMQFMIQIAAFFIKAMVIISILTITINFAGRFTLFGGTIWNFCSYLNIRPFAWLANLFPKLVDQDPTCPAYQPPSTSEDRGFVLPCEDNNYCINMSDPCPGANIGCGIPLPSGVFEGDDGCCGCLTKIPINAISNNCAGTDNPLDCEDNSSCTCKVKFICIGAAVFVADENTCDAIDQIEKWKCCVIYNLAENRNVIRRSFFDAWVLGTSYLFQFKYKRRAKNNGEIKEKFCGPGSDHLRGNNYHKNECCAHDFRTSSSECAQANKCCDRCIVRGPNETRLRPWDNIEAYHEVWHNNTVRNDCNGQPCGNGATDIDDMIYCNAYASTKIVSLGRMEMCEDTVNEIEKCIDALDCAINVYQQNPSFYTGTFYEEGWDPNFWVSGMQPTSYQDPREVFLFLMDIVDCKVKKLFNNQGSGCHEKELEDSSGKEFYKIIKEVSKIHTEIVLQEDSSGNDEFWPPTGVNLITGEGSGFLFDVKYGQRFNPCVDNNNCLPPPAPWAPSSVFLATLVTDSQPIWYGFGSNYNPNKNIPYYYFGINPGKTAIEKLRKEYFVEQG